MFGIIIYDIIFFAIPIMLLLFFGICLYRYRGAVSQNKANPGTFSNSEIKKRKILFIISCVSVVVLVTVAVGFIVLLFMAIAFM